MVLKSGKINKLTQEQKGELFGYRKSNGNYKGTWTGKPKKGMMDPRRVSLGPRLPSSFVSMRK